VDARIFIDFLIDFWNDRLGVEALKQFHQSIIPSIHHSKMG
jgi:hypothetical protein